MKKKTIKAWAIFDKETGALAQYNQGVGDYMIESKKARLGDLHKTFESIPVTITYELPHDQPK